MGGSGGGCGDAAAESVTGADPAGGGSEDEGRGERDDAGEVVLGETARGAGCARRTGGAPCAVLTHRPSTAVNRGTSLRLLPRLGIRPTGSLLARTRRNGKHENITRAELMHPDRTRSPRALHNA